MAEKTCSDVDFQNLYESLGPSECSKQLGINVRTVHARRKRLERLNDIAIQSPIAAGGILAELFCGRYAKRFPITIKNGIVMVGSDQHYTPGIIHTAHRGFVHLARELKPYALIGNGDALDGVGISRHPLRGWEKHISVKDQLECVDERLTEWEDACKAALLIWDVGNHDMRFDARLAQNNREFDGVKGMTLSDHFPRWKFAVSTWINNEIVVKHRFKGGIHAAHNNTLNAGRTMITGHLHSLKVTPFDDYNGTRWGVDTGTMADPYGEHADYTEDAPLNHRQGFIVLTFWNGKLLWPEIVRVLNEKHIDFRGKNIRV